MDLRVNGQTIAIDPPCTVAGLLERLEVAEGACAVEVNAQVVKRRDHERFELSAGDTVEIVTLVGGG